MGRQPGRRSAKFLFPLGQIEALEDEVFFLMERQGQNYSAMMELPYSRRKRFSDRKYTLEKTASNIQRQNTSRRIPRRRR